jgi:hypothetical protein
MREPTRDEVMEQVQLICKSDGFARMKRGKELLRYVVEETLKHPQRSPRIKGVTIAIEVFKKIPSEFDSRKDPIVKMAMRDLRRKLNEYYQNEGYDDRVVIEVDLGSYVPKFTLNLPFAPLEMDPQALHYVTLVRQFMDERHSGAEALPEMLAGDLDEKYPDHPQLLSLYAMQGAVNATYDGFPAAREGLRKAELLIKKVHSHDVEPWECTVTDAWITAAL